MIHDLIEFIGEMLARVIFAFAVAAFVYCLADFTGHPLGQQPQGVAPVASHQ